MDSGDSSELFFNDADFQANLETIRHERISGPYPEHFVRIFPKWNDGFQLDISISIQDSAKIAESMVLLQLPPLGDASPWLSVLFQLQLPDQANKWRSSQLLETPNWMVGESLVMAQRQGYTNEWHMVRAVCHVSYGPESYQAALVHLYTLASCTFRAQPLRPFLHGILIYKSTFELWTFDRSGTCVSRPLDLSVAYLDAKERNSENFHIFLPGEVLELSPKPIVAPTAIFGAGPLCYYARKQNEQRWSHVVKFKWRHDLRSKEEDIFSVIQENSIADVQDPAENGNGGSSLARHLKYSALTGLRFRNHTCMCFVYTPLGLPLSSFRSTSELLGALRDAIQVHRDLLQKVKILHVDISSSNILIDQNTRRGMLIDFDSAMDLSRRTPTGKSFVATLNFLAVGLARGDPNTYRHDLESFFYVFLWMVACKKGSLPASSRLTRWTLGAVEDWEEAIEARAHDMTRYNFALLLDEWDPRFEKCKALALELWQLLFRNEDDLFWGTDTSEDGMNALYDGFLHAFEKTIDGNKSNSKLQAK
ncbi:hypothetical protein PWT90_01979 [Aphanocladium album]|nr:hypothetical protein PWT90_01979 [Aphanocladium album]